MLFADIVGSTALIERADAEAAHNLLAPALKEMARLVEQHGGHVSEVQGDGMLAIFGAPRAIEDHPVQACCAAMAIQSAIAAPQVGIGSAQKLGVRIGISCGVVLVTTDGEGPDATCHAVGIPVHLAARVQTMTPPGEIGLSSHANQRVAQWFRTQLLGRFALKGFSTPEPIYLLRGPKKASEASGVTPAHTPFVGRSSELQVLLERLSELRPGAGGVVLIEGEAGIGKSRLLLEAHHAASKDIGWFSSQWNSYEHRLGYKPIIDIIGSWMGAEALTEWARFARQMDSFLGDDAGQSTPYLAVLMGVPVPPPWDERIKYLTPDVLGNQVRGAVRRYVLRHALARPCVVALEDLHWADESSLALLEHLLPLTLEAPLLFVLTSRSDSDPANRLVRRMESLGASATRIALGPLEVSESLKLLEAHLGASSATKYLRQQVLARTGGNPFFIQEVIHNIRADARAAPLTDRLLDARPELEAVPETIEEVILARVDRLKVDTRQLLMRAAVIGREFLERVLKMLEDGAQGIDRDLVDLQHQQFIREAARSPELAYVFCHALTQQTIYDSILTETRKRLHRRVAYALESIYADRSGEIASVLAFHYARAEVGDKALAFLLTAAGQAEKISADAEALRYYEQALRAFESLQSSEGQWQQAFIRRRLGVLHSRRGNVERAESYFAAALALKGDRFPTPGMATRFGIARELVRHLLNRLFRRTALPTEDAVEPATEQHMRTYEGLAWLMMQTDQDRMLYATLRVLNLSEGSSWRESNAKALGAVGFAFDVLGRHGLALTYHERATAIAGQSKDLGAQALVADLSGGHYLFVGEWDRALDCLRRAQELAYRIGDLDTWASACGWQCLLLCERGKLADVRALADGLLAAGRDTGFSVAERWGQLFRGAYLRRAGQAQEAEAALRDALDAATACGDAVTQIDSYAELGIHNVRGGQPAAGRAFLQMGQELVRQRGIRIQSVVPIRNGLVEAELAMLGRTEIGLRRSWLLKRHCAQAVSTARRYSVGLVWALRLSARFNALRGDQDEARRYWNEAIDMARRLGAAYEEALTLMDRGALTADLEQEQAGRDLLQRCGSLAQP